MVHYRMCGPCAVGLGFQATGQKGIPSFRLQSIDQGAETPWVHDPVLLIEGGQASR